MTPVVLGLTLAIPLAVLTSRRFPARALLCTPEERSPPEALSRLGPLQAVYAQPDAEPVRRLLAEPRLLAAHLAMLPPPRRRGEPHDPALLVGRAKIEEAERLEGALASFTRAELLAVLGDRPALRLLEELRAAPVLTPACNGNANPVRPGPTSCRSSPP